MMIERQEFNTPDRAQEAFDASFVDKMTAKEALDAIEIIFLIRECGRQEEDLKRARSSR